MQNVTLRVMTKDPPMLSRIVYMFVLRLRLTGKCAVSSMGDTATRGYQIQHKLEDFRLVDLILRFSTL